MPGLLLYLLGNENNYGLFWEGAEELKTFQLGMEYPASHAMGMYKLFNEATVAMKKMDGSHPVAICNGDLLFLDLIVEEMQRCGHSGCQHVSGNLIWRCFSKSER